MAMHEQLATVHLPVSLAHRDHLVLEVSVGREDIPVNVDRLGL